jgi:plasmid segregation protein ParM
VSQKIGIVDIGFRTTDFVLLDHLRYIERGSSTTDNGMSKCFSLIANKLRQKTGVNVELYRLYQAIFSGSIKIRGKEYNITNLKNKVYSHFASQIVNDINRIWENDWDIDLIVLTGGGAKELMEYLKPLIEGNVILVENKSDPRLNNVKGYLKYAMYDLSKHTVDSSAEEEEKTNASREASETK